MSYNKDQVSAAWKLISVQSWLCDLVFIIWCHRGDYGIQILMACSKSQTHFEGKKKQRMFQKRKIKHILKTKLLLNQGRAWLTDLKNVCMRLPVNITENKLINENRLHSQFLQIPVKSVQVQRHVNLNFSAFRDKSTYKIAFIWLSLFCIK